MATMPVGTGVSKSYRPVVPVVMTSEHPKVSEFLERLAGPQGIRLNAEFDVTAPHLGRCHGKPNWPRVRAILAAMGLSPVAIEQSLVFFQVAELPCDCAVFAGLLSAEAPYEFQIASSRKLVATV